MTTTATELAARIRDGEVTSREVTEDLLRRIAADTTVNAVVVTRAAEALAEAEAADAAVAAGQAVGPLHGVPVTVKEAFDVAGMPTTWGNPEFAGFMAEADAVVVERLRAAGAVVVGKSNVHAMLADFGRTANDVYGRTSNPADPSRTPGGSSGGAAAALAAGLSYLDYGSDLVGSIRLPAAYCGVYGLKPTNGLVDQRGFQVPGTPYLASELPNLSTLGPLANSAADLRTALNVTAGPQAPYSWVPRPPRHRRLEDFTVGVVADHPAARVSSEVGDALSDTVDRLAQQGVKIVEGWPDGVDPVEQAEEFGQQVEVFFALYGGEPSELSVDELVGRERRRMQARARWDGYFESVDVFLCPTSFTVAFPHDAETITTSYGEQAYDAQVFWIAHASLTGHPALSMPIGRTPGGLPVGAQVIGPWHEDDTAITFADLVHLMP